MTIKQREEQVNIPRLFMNKQNIMYFPNTVGISNFTQVQYMEAARGGPTRTVICKIYVYLLIEI